MSKESRNRPRVPRRRSRSSSSSWGHLANWLHVALVVGVPLALSQELYNYIDLPRGILIQVGAVLLLAIWLMGAVSQGKLRIVRTPLDLPLLGIVLWAGLSLLWAGNIYEGLTRWSVWGACLVFFFLTVNMIQSERDTRRLLGALLLVGTLVGALGIFQYLLEVDWVLQLRPPAATFGNRNMAAQFMVLTIPLAAGFFLLTGKRIHVLLTVMVLGVLCLFLFYTGTRAGWLAAAVEFCLLAILLARDHFKWKLAPPRGQEKKRALVVCAVVGFILINLTPSGFQWQLGTAVDRILEVLVLEESESRQATDQVADQATEFQVQPLEVSGLRGDTLTVRMRIWQNTLRMGEEHLLTGVGIGNFEIFYPRYVRSAVVDQVFDEDGQWKRAHNDYAQIFAELGLVGFFLLGWLLFALVKVCVTLLGQETKGELRYLVIGVVVSLTGLSIIAFFSFPFQMVTPTFVFALYLGVLGGHYGRQPLEDESSRPHRKASILLSPRAARVGAGVTLVGLLILLPFEYKQVQADLYFKKMVMASQRKDWAAAISHGREGYQYLPSRKEFLFHVGQAYFETGNLDAGIEATKEFMKAYPYFANGHHNIGMAYAVKGDEDSAFHHFNQAFEIIPTYAKTHFAVAQLYELRDNLDEALEHYRSAVRGSPDNTLFLVGLGQVAFRKGLHQEAMDAFEAAVKHDPDNIAHYLKFGTVAANMGKLPEAKVAFSKALELDPKSAEAHYRLGMILFVSLKEREEGIQHFKEALDLKLPAPYASEVRRLMGEERE